jgi:FdhD protein
MKEKRTDKILTFRSGELIEVEDSLAIEGKLNVLINGKQAVSLYCTPTKLRELAIGFVLTEGIAEGVCTERMTLMYSDDGATVEMHAEGEVSLEGGTVTSGCVGGMTFGGKERENAHDDPLKVKISDIQSMMKRFTQKEGLYTETGCAHRAALMHGDDVISYAEDIGRRNT